jgi:hypothetical protein
MSKIGFPVISFENHPVWIGLVSYVIGPTDAAIRFKDQLARENGWSLFHADRVLVEYKRFCFLAATCKDPVTPSDAVDQAWHLHLTYTHDYWDRFCPDILGRLLHHGPTSGGGAEQQRYYTQYAQTLKSYEEVFGQCPPVDLWPNAAKRLRQDPKARRVHPRDGWFVTNRQVTISALILAFAFSLYVFNR